jgi:hypothetical protein
MCNGRLKKVLHTVGRGLGLGMTVGGIRDRPTPREKACTSSVTIQAISLLFRARDA